jgi:hypothetical protein
MRPVLKTITNLMLVAPGCDDLPAHVGEEGIETFWRPDAEELAALAAGAQVRLTVRGSAHPPVRLDVVIPHRGDKEQP